MRPLIVSKSEASADGSEEKDAFHVKHHVYEVPVLRFSFALDQGADFCSLTAHGDIRLRRAGASDA